MAAASAVAAGGGAGVPGKRECMEGRLALVGLLFFLVAMAEMAVPSAAAEYKVGDSKGWTIIGGVNYTAWAASKTFHVGDTIVFEYNTQFHNVMQVSAADYSSCNANNPMNTYTSGKDSITLKTAGHHYFLCGVPTHCAIGQKVDVNALASSPSSSGPAAAPGSPPSSVPSATTPSSVSGAPSAPPPGRSAAAPAASGHAHAVGSAVALLAVLMALFH